MNVAITGDEWKSKDFGIDRNVDGLLRGGVKLVNNPLPPSVLTQSNHALGENPGWGRLKGEEIWK